MAADRQRGVGWRVEDFEKATEAMVEAVRREKPALADEDAVICRVADLTEATVGM